MRHEIYAPREDSFLLLRVLSNEVPKLLGQNPDLKVLEMGSGSGIQLETMKKLGVKKENIFAADVNKEAVNHCNNLGFNCVESNLFEAFKGKGIVGGSSNAGGTHKFDLIIFNPPYLPRDIREPETSQLITTGGKKGNEVINKFIKQSKEHLNGNGRIFLLVSSHTPKINFGDYKKKLLDSEKFFFEELFVWELK